MKHIYRTFIAGIFGTLFITFSTIAHSEPFRVVGYFASWNNVQAMSRTLDYSKLTHINYAFTNVTDTLGSLAEMGADLDTLVAHAHAAGVSVLISMGGGSMDQTTIDRYFYLIKTSQRRARFIEHISNYLDRYNLDGFDVDIEGPRINEDYGAFISQLVDSLRPQGKLITAALGDWGGDAVPDEVVPMFDFINIMSYDAAGNWDQNNVAQHSPFELARDGIEKWASRGALKKNLVVGLPFYGYAFNDLKSLGFIYYKDILQRYPYAYDQDTVASIILYNGTTTIQRKTCLALDSAGGVMIWELAYDASGEHSLLKAITDSRNSYKVNDQHPVVRILTPVADTTITDNEITITTSVTDQDGVFRKSTAYLDDVFIAESSDSLNEFTFRNLGAGFYNIVVEDIDHQFRGGRDTLLLTVNPGISRAPFNNQPASVPGKIEAENYDMGGQDVTYHDATAANEGKSYRADKVDIEGCYDSGSGFDVGWTLSGEWLEYTVEAADSDYYDFDFRTSSVASNISLSLQMDTVNVVNNLILTRSGGWQVWKTTTAQHIFIPAGKHVFRLKMNSGGFNINYMLVRPSVVSPVETNNNIRVSMFPNPANNKLYIRLNTADNGEVRIYSSTGQEILQENYYDNAGAYTEIDISSYAPGLYHLQIISDNKICQSSFIKK